MPQIVSGIWGKVRTDDILDRAVTRAKLEYPTEDVSFALLAVIDKLKRIVWAIGEGVGHGTLDSFTDKAIEGQGGGDAHWFGRWVDKDNFYVLKITTGASTADFLIGKNVGGTYSDLATESVDLNSTGYLCKLEISGSTLNAYRDDMSTAKITTTDTDISSGSFGTLTYYRAGSRFTDHIGCYLRAPSSPLPKPFAIIEVPVTGSGKTEEDPIRPQLPQDLRDPKELGLNIDKPQVNLKSVTYGAIDYKGGNTMIIAIYKHGAPYLDPKRFEDVLAIAKNKWKVPSNVQEAEEIWKELKKANPDMIAGKHTIAYHLIGDANIEPCSVADFYHGNLIQEQKIKGVPEWELRRTLLRWKDRLEKARINSELKEKHMKKLEECLKR